jgi:hypothetical protein
MRTPVFAALLLLGCGPAPAASFQADEPPIIIPEVARCRAGLKSAQDEVETCRGRCDYGTFCCPIRMCRTTAIEAWKKQADSCAELGVTASEILWPRPTTGEVDHPECEIQQGGSDAQ